MQVKAMRGCAEYDKDGNLISGGTLLFYWLSDGPHLMLYRDWHGPELVPGADTWIMNDQLEAW